nr:MAG TPA: hypothetical protein [Caudoviricetes sp.]
MKRSTFSKIKGQHSFLLLPRMLNRMLTEKVLVSLVLLLILNKVTFFYI